ncbi:restriction endonuclease subunit S [Massilia agri]|uniref:Restriction endonuclease subunit S n=1 Tax=Massilia agri TaxID=1886785 RepID=A0ABT2AH86_9BURK|nr:restriction endonuclease subunit S [Massilia agri]MCS0595546.1 restriction endonuclease subunit S [Massilia agri]
MWPAEWLVSGVDDVRRDTKDGLATGPFGSSVSAKFFQNDGVPLIRGSNLSEAVGERLVEDDYVFVSEEKAAEFPRAVTRPGDLVFTCWGTIGQVGLIDGRARFDRYLISNKQMKLSPDPTKADSLFLYYLFKSPDLQAAISNVSIGSSVPGFNLGQLRGLRFPLPPLPEQKAIAAVLGALDDKIEQNRRTSRALDELAQATFKAWFVDFAPIKAKAAGQTSFPGMPSTVFAALADRLTDSPIGPAPEGWSVRALSQVCQIISGGTPKRSEAAYWGGDIPWYSIKDAPPNGEPWVYFTSEHISQAGLAGSAATLAPIGCTIISARGTVGRLGLVARPMAFNQSCYGLLPSDEVSYRHLYLLLREVVDELKQRSHGSVFDTITRQTFDTVNVVFPPPEVLAEFENVTAPWFDLLLALSNESDKLSELRDYLLPRLVSGAIRVKGHHV